MQIGKTLYIKNRRDWRKWLEKNHDKESEVWLIYYRKASGKPRISYNNAVEEALCFGWIDSIEKGIDEERFAQRFSPRKAKSSWSEANLERVRRLVSEEKMTEAGLSKIKNLGLVKKSVYEKIPHDILRELKTDPEIWKKFQKFPGSYKRIRIGWIDMSRSRPDEFKKRLKYFLKMTKQGKRFGMVQ